MASAIPTTMTEALQRVVQDISAAMTTPDADIQFLTQLQGVIVGRMRAGVGGGMGQQRPGMGGGPQPQPQPQQQPAMAGAGGPPPPGQPSSPGGPGQMQGAPTPNGVTPLAQLPPTDELRRQIAGQAGA